MMCKKESVICLLISIFVLLMAATHTQAAAELDPNEPTMAELDPNEPLMAKPDSVVVADPNQIAIADSNDLALESDDAEMVDPDWPEDFNVEDVKVVLNFQDTLVSEVLDYLSREAGLIIISDSFISGRVNLVSKKPLGIDEVIALVSSVLNKEGYAAIRTGRTLKIISLTAAKSANLPVITANKPEDVVEGDDVVTCIIPIRYANAIQLVDDIEPLLSDYAVVSSNEASNSLIITDTTSNIRRLVKIVKSVDTQISSVADIKVFVLEYADADSTAELINEIFEQQTASSSSNQRSNQQQRGGDRGGRGSQQQQQQSSAGVVQNVPVVASADERTNAVVVSGPADVLVLVEEVVKELDNNPNEEHELFLYKLKYAQAENVKDRLNSLFQELENINQQNARNTGGRGGGGGNTSSSSSSSVSDEVYIEADEDTNSLIIMTSTKNYDKIKGIIELLDIPIPQVLIKILLAELTTNDELDIGVEWSNLNLKSNGDSFLNAFTNSSTITEGFISEIETGDLTATLRALQSAGDLNILSRPYILTSNNQTATINVGQRFPFIEDSTRTDNDSVINTVTYEDIGISLEVTPSINSDGLVIMDITPEISNVAAETVTISEDFKATVFNTRTAQSRVAVPHGSTIVIGGLMQDVERDNEEKIPLLGDLPILGGLFKWTNTEKLKTELLIFLTPQVASDIADLELLSNHEESLSEFINEPEGNEARYELIQEHLEGVESVYQKPDKVDVQ